MGAYALFILPMLNSLLGFDSTNKLQAKKPTFANDQTISRKLADFK